MKMAINSHNFADMNNLVVKRNRAYMSTVLMLKVKMILENIFDVEDDVLGKIPEATRNICIKTKFGRRGFFGLEKKCSDELESTC